MPKKTSVNWQREAGHIVMKEHTDLAERYWRQQEAELGTMDRWETVWSERRNVTAGRVMSPRAETSFYTFVQQHQQPVWMALMWHSTASVHSNHTGLQSACSRVRAKHTRWNKLSQGNTAIHPTIWLWQADRNTLIFSWEFSFPALTNRHTHTHSRDSSLTEAHGRWRMPHY